MWPLRGYSPRAARSPSSTCTLCCFGGARHLAPRWRAGSHRSFGDGCGCQRRRPLRLGLWPNGTRAAGGRRWAGLAGNETSFGGLIISGETSTKRRDRGLVLRSPASSARRPPLEGGQAQVVLTRPRRLPRRAAPSIPRPRRARREPRRIIQAPEGIPRDAGGIARDARGVIRAPREVISAPEGFIRAAIPVEIRALGRPNDTGTSPPASRRRTSARQRKARAAISTRRAALASPKGRIWTKRDARATPRAALPRQIRRFEEPEGSGPLPRAALMTSPGARVTPRDAVASRRAARATRIRLPPRGGEQPRPNRTSRQP
jgi:hypothetical protein